MPLSGHQITVPITQLGTGDIIRLIIMPGIHSRFLDIETTLIFA